jgi:aminocarboxymuconate-semialdehyde decarboxylase
MRIDIHTHILPPELPDFASRFGYGNFIRLEPCKASSDVEMRTGEGKLFRRVGPNCFPTDTRIAEMRSHQVDVQVLSTVPVLFSYWAKPQDGLTVCRFLNDHLASVVSENRQRYVGLGTVPLQAPELAVKEARRGIEELGLKGFQIGTHVNQWNLSDEALFPFYEACEALGAPLFIHPWEMMGAERMPKYWLPWLVGMPAETSLAMASLIFGGVFDRFPTLRFAFAHGGGAFPFTLGRWQQGYEVRPDLCAVDCLKSPKEYLGHFYVDSLVHDPKALKYLIELVGVEKVCLGSDYPFPLGETKPGESIEALSVEQQAWVFEKSALNWLGLKADAFR